MTQHTTTEKPRLGYIGMGGMGSRMAARLLEAGYPLTVYNRNREKAQPLVQRGAQFSESPRDLAQRSDIVLTSLTNDEAVRAVLLSDDGAFAGATQGATIIEMSSISPSTSRELSAQAQQRKLIYLDAPVSGSTPQAEQGQLTIFVGGDESAYQRCKPILDVMAAKTLYMGVSGLGHAMKLVVNTLLGLEMQAIAEAIALGQSSGIAHDRLIDALGETTVIAPAHKAKLQNARTEQYPATFPLALMHKDFDLILNEAATLSVPMPATASAQQMCGAELGRAQREHHPDLDYSAVIQLMEDLAGVTGTHVG